MEACTKLDPKMDALEIFEIFTRPNVCVDVPCENPKIIKPLKGGRRRIKKVQKGGGKIWNHIKRICGFQKTMVVPIPRGQESIRAVYSYGHKIMGHAI